MTTIRKKNQKEYNWGKLGLELIVVFLGVTAGFLLNNWRTSAIDRELETNYKTSFLRDVNSNISLIKSNIEKDSLWLVRATPLLNMIRTNSLSDDSASVSIDLISNFSKIVLNTNTYENITNGGNFNLIRDFELRENLVNYQISIVEVATLNDYFFSFYNDFTMPFILSEISVANGEFMNPKTIQSSKFSNVFSLQYFSVYQRIEVYRNLYNESKNLRDKLTASLN